MRVQTKHAYHRSLVQVIEFISHRQSGPIRVPDLAEFAGFSRFHLSRFIFSVTGESLSDLVRRLHLERSAYHLQRTRQKIADVAREAGYATPESFSRAFNQAYGVPPSAFRKGRALEWRLAAASDVHWCPDPNRYEYEIDPLADVELAIVTLPRLRLAAARYVGYPCDTHRLWSVLKGMRNWSAWVNHQTRFIGIYHDNPDTASDWSNLRGDLCFTLPDGVAPPAGMRLLEIPGGVFAATKNYVDPTDLARLWPVMAKAWVPISGTRPRNVPAFEMHESWPVPWNESRTRLHIGLEADLGDPGHVRPFLNVDPATHPAWGAEAAS